MVRFLALLGALVTLTWGSALQAQVAGQWDVTAGPGTPLSISISQRANPRDPSVTDTFGGGDLDAADYDAINLLEMRGGMIGRDWSGNWYLHGAGSFQHGMPRCAVANGPLEGAVRRRARFYGRFKVTFNLDRTRFDGTWQYECLRPANSGVPLRLGPPVRISGVRRAVQTSERVTPDRSDAAMGNRYNAVKNGRYETNWGAAVIRTSPDGVIVQFGYYWSSVSHTMTGGGWGGNGPGTGVRPPAVGHYFLAMYRDYPNWIPPNNPPPLCDEDFPLGNRAPWDFGALDAPRWGTFRLDFSRYGDSFDGYFIPCVDNTYAAENRTPQSQPWNTRFSGRYVGEITPSRNEWIGPAYVAVKKETLPAVPMAPRSGPCHSVPGQAVVTPERCRLAPARTLGLVFQKDIPGGITRVIFKPLTSDFAAMSEAVRRNQPIPRHASLRDVEVSQVGRFDSGTTYRTIYLTPPGSTCRSDYWEVLIVDGRGVVHSGNGIVSFECGPGTIAEGW